MTEVLPLYLHGLSTTYFGPTLEQFLGSGAGLSAPAITRLTAQWQDEAHAFGQRDLSGTDYVYLCVDGTHLKVSLEHQKLCLLVMIGVRGMAARSLSPWPMATANHFPATREQRCWWHKQAKVLPALPKSAHPGALAAMREIYNAEDIDQAQLAIKAFDIDYGAK
jgi:putative transposase